jgi:hypothetical protein
VVLLSHTTSRHTIVSNLGSDKATAASAVKWESAVTGDSGRGYTHEGSFDEDGGWSLEQGQWVDEQGTNEGIATAED